MKRYFYLRKKKISCQFPSTTEEVQRREKEQEKSQTQDGPLSLFKFNSHTFAHLYLPCFFFLFPSLVIRQHRRAQQHSIAALSQPYTSSLTVGIHEQSAVRKPQDPIPYTGSRKKCPIPRSRHPHIQIDPGKPFDRHSHLSSPKKETSPHPN